MLPRCRRPQTLASRRTQRKRKSATKSRPAPAPRAAGWGQGPHTHRAPGSSGAGPGRGCARASGRDVAGRARRAEVCAVAWGVGRGAGMRAGGRYGPYERPLLASWPRRLCGGLRGSERQWSERLLDVLGTGWRTRERPSGDGGLRGLRASDPGVGPGPAGLGRGVLGNDEEESDVKVRAEKRQR